MSPTEAEEKEKKKDKNTYKYTITKQKITNIHKHTQRYFLSDSSKYYNM